MSAFMLTVYAAFAICFTSCSAGTTTSIDSTTKNRFMWNMTARDYISKFAKDELKYIPQNITFDDSSTTTTEGNEEYTEYDSTTEDTTVLYLTQETPLLVGKDSKIVAISENPMQSQLVTDGMSDKRTNVTMQATTITIAESTEYEEPIQTKAKSNYSAISLHQAEVDTNKALSSENSLNLDETTPTINTNSSKVTDHSEVVEQKASVSQIPKHKKLQIAPKMELIPNEKQDTESVHSNPSSLSTTTDFYTKSFASDKTSNLSSDTTPTTTSKTISTTPFSTKTEYATTVSIFDSTVSPISIIPSSVTSAVLSTPPSTTLLNDDSKTADIDSPWPNDAITAFIDTMKNFTGPSANKTGIDYSKFNTKPGTVGVVTTVKPKPADNNNWKKKEDHIPTTTLIGLIMIGILTAICIISSIIAIQWYKRHKSLEDTIALMSGTNGQRRQFCYYDSTI